MSSALHALLHPFTLGLLPPPGPGRALLLRAEADPALDDDWRRALVCEQPFKPEYDRLAARGLRVEPVVNGDGFDIALCLLSKHKAESLANLGRAWAALRPGGVLVCAGGIDVGAASVEKALKSVTALTGSLSKYHCKVFWARRDEDAPAALADWAETGALRMVDATGFTSRPGLYNWDKVDRGSALLAANLPADISGRVADLGCGWGFLSARLLQTAPAIASLDLYEAEWWGIEAAKANLARIPTGARIGYHWHDVTAGIPAASLDWVVMNPPFHQGKAADFDLGRAFIATATEALVPKGRLIFVANRHLPYEASLEKGYASVRTVIEDDSFKVIEAVRDRGRRR